MARNVANRSNRHEPAGFGRRGSARSAHQTSSRPAVRGETRTAPDERGRSAVSGMSQSDEAVLQASTAESDRTTGLASLSWAYFQAVIIAFASTLGMMAVALDGANNPLAEFQLYKLLMGAFVAITLAPMMAIPAFVLARIVSGLKVPRGYADVIVGGILGSPWILMQLSDGKSPSATTVCFFLGGIVGGFAFWRARGYPGTSHELHRALDGTYMLTRNSM